MQRVQTAGFEGSSPRRGPDEAVISPPGILYAGVSQAPGELVLTVWSPMKIANDLPFPLSVQVESHQFDLDKPPTAAVEVLPGAECPLKVSQSSDERLRMQLKGSKVNP